MRAARIVADMKSPLPLLDAYRTMGRAPEPDLRRVLALPGRVASEFHLSFDREAFNRASARVL
jgi:hypothetical protein